MGESQESTVVGVRIAESRKSNLEDFVAEHEEYRNLPDLFRTAVAHEVSDDYGRLSGQQSDGATEESIGELATTVTHLRADIEDLSHEITALTEEVRSETPGDVMDAMNAILPRLPSDESDAMDYKEVADMFEDASPETTWKALVKLHDTGIVHRTPEDEWYRSE